MTTVDRDYILAQKALFDGLEAELFRDPNGPVDSYKDMPPGMKERFHCLDGLLRKFFFTEKKGYVDFLGLMIAGEYLDELAHEGPTYLRIPQRLRTTLSLLGFGVTASGLCGTRTLGGKKALALQVSSDRQTKLLHGKARVTFVLAAHRLHDALNAEPAEVPLLLAPLNPGRSDVDHFFAEIYKAILKGDLLPGR